MAGPRGAFLAGAVCTVPALVLLAAVRRRAGGAPRGGGAQAAG
ncbi:hypothetical protein AB0910_13095 [Streptomyces sp. NPDC047002]